MFKNKQAMGGVAIAGILAFVTLISPSTGSSILVSTASANYGGGGGGGTKKVEVCQNGKTIKVAKRAESALIKQGATPGACLEPEVLGASTTSASQAERENLQRQLISLLQQLLSLLQSQNKAQ